MFQKINRYLLLNRPQLWNTRVVWALLVLLALHILFYLAGVFHFDGYKMLHAEYGLDSDVVLSSNIGFSMLVGSIFTIVWLVFYFRNNPFKSYYPLPKGYFFVELSIIFLIVISTVTFYKSFANGFWQHVQRSSTDVNMKEEANTLNLAFGLIPSNSSLYKIHACCDSLNYRDSLQGLRDSLYGKKNSTELDDQHLELIDTALDRFSRREGEERYYSYLNFCNQYYTPLPDYDTIPAREEISAQLQQWLTSGNKKDVARTLSRFEKMCDRYQIDVNVNITGYADKVFANRNFAIYKFIDDNQSYDERYQPSRVKPYLEFREVIQTLENISRSRHRNFDLKFWLANLYLAMLFSIAIFTYRITSVRVWLISLVGAGVIAIVAALLAATLKQEVAIYIMLLMILGAFFMAHVVFMNAGKKIMAGVNLVWYTWALPFLGMVVLALLTELSKPATTYDANGNAVVHTSPSYNFLSDHSAGILLVYLILLFIYTGTFLSRNFRNWMAMAEE